MMAYILIAFGAFTLGFLINTLLRMGRA
jgi:hypothetical protein